MQQHRLAQIHFIEPLGTIGEQHNGKFQTLGFMNGHDAHHISRALRLRCGNFAARLPQLSDIAHKGKQAAAAAALKAARQFNERRNMILPRLAVRHRAEHAHRTGLIDNVPQQLMHRQIGRQHAQLRELVEKCVPKALILINVAKGYRFVIFNARLRRLALGHGVGELVGILDRFACGQGSELRIGALGVAA